MLVVGAEHTAVSVLTAEEGHQGLQIPGGGAFPDHDELAPFQLGQSVLQVVAFVVGVDAGGNVGVEVVVHQIRGVTVDLFVMGLCRHDLLHRLLIAVDGAYKVHHLRKSLNAGVVIEAVNGPVVQNGAGFVQRGGGNAGGQHEPHVYRKILRGLKHIFDAVGAHDVGNFVRIGHNGSGAVGQDGLHELCGTDQRTFQMDVGVQKAGEDNFAGAVHFLPAVVAAHADNEALCHGNVHVGQLVGEHINKCGVLQHQIRRLPPGGGSDDPLLFQHLSVDLSCIAFRHSTTPFIKFNGIALTYDRHKEI